VSGLPLYLTPAGRAALVDAANTGTSGLLISHIGVSASGTGVVGGALQGEIKRLTTFAGQVVADDTIHVTIRDDSNGVYSLRAFALYLEDGTLLAWYAQASVILEKSEQAMLLLSADLQFQSLNVTSLEFGDSNWTNPIATTTVYGVLRLATNEVALAGTSVVDAVTPAGLFSVLNSRFGVGAPSEFVKGLLTAASAALLRAAIGLGTASVRNEGAGNGLDADLLDGQHGAYYRDWANLTNKPATFAPSAHRHAWADLDNVPSTASRWPTFAEVTDKPATYTPSAHSHAAADIVAGVLDAARIPDLAQSKITGLTAALAAKAPTNAPVFSGGMSLYGNYKIHDPVGGGVAAEWGLGYSSASDGHTFIANRNAAGFIELFAGNGSNRLRVGPAGLHYNDGPVWCSANFNPSSKLDYRGSLESTAATTGNWNDATLTGWYRSSPGTPNAPEATQWYMGTVIRHDASWVEQVVRQFAGDPNVEYFRMNFAGTWSAWQRRYTNQAALDARYARHLQDVVFRDVTAHRGNGTGVIFLNETQSRYLFFDATKYVLPGAALDVGGTVYAPGFAQSSSRRYKIGIEAISEEEALALLCQIDFVSYNLKSDGSKAMGVVAEDLADGPLDFVVKRNEQGQPDAVDYQPLFVLAARSLQGLAERVARLEGRTGR
jgi:hypothetical protein